MTKAESRLKEQEAIWNRFQKDFSELLAMDETGRPFVNIKNLLKTTLDYGVTEGILLGMESDRELMCKIASESLRGYKQELLKKLEEKKMYCERADCKQIENFVVKWSDIESELK